MRDDATETDACSLTQKPSVRDHENGVRARGVAVPIVQPRAAIVVRVARLGAVPRAAERDVRRRREAVRPRGVDAPRPPDMHRAGRLAAVSGSLSAVHDGGVRRGVRGGRVCVLGPGVGEEARVDGGEPLLELGAGRVDHLCLFRFFS